MVIMILQEILFKKIKDFNALIDNKPYFDQPVKKTNKKRMKNLLKCQETMIMQKKIH